MILFLKTDHTLYQHVRKLIYLRKSCSSLTQGAIYFRQADSYNGGFLIFSRIYNNMEIITIINTNNNNAMTVPTQIVIDSNINNVNGMKYYNVLDLSVYGYVGTSASHGSYLYLNNPIVTLLANGYAIFVRQDQIGTFNQNYGIAPCKY